MRFAIDLPAWALVLLAAGALAIAWRSYVGTTVRVGGSRRAALVALRTVTLLLLIACLLRPVRIVSDSGRDVVVPVLLDVSRSMSVPDAGGRTRIAAAEEVIDAQLLPSLSGTFTPEVWTFGDVLRSRAGAVRAEARRSDLGGALRDIRARYRDRRVAGIVVISDGGDTGAEDVAAVLDRAALPVYTVGVGSPQSGFDYEVLEVAAGEATVKGAAVDLTVSAVSRGARGPYELRLLENGTPIDVRHVTPAVDGSPVRAAFTVAPVGDAATVYTVEVPAAAAELVTENNRRSVAVAPPGAPRRLLVIEGAPAFEHSFLKRALAADPALEIDSVVRKGRDTSGEPTFFVQAPAERAPLLTGGFPKDRATLYGYDAVVLANVDPEALNDARLEELARFVSERGGGLLVLGAKSFAQPGLGGTPLSEVLPVTLSARGGGSAERAPIAVTDDGAVHPVMRVALDAPDALARWRAVPPLPGVSPVGAPRRGAQVLATVRGPSGEQPLVAVQRYGNGRSMVFTGEASWRWRMQMPSSDRTYELFWRQAARWLASGARGRVSVMAPAAPLPGDSSQVAIDVRHDDFSPAADAQVALRVTRPDGQVVERPAALIDPAAGRYAADVQFDYPGLYRLAVDDAPDRWLLVGGADRELADPRLNEQVLGRLAHTTGGKYLSVAEVGELPELLSSAVESAAPRVEEAWHSVWIFVVIVMLLTSEWLLRRRWGLR